MSRNQITETVRKRISGRQFYKCANKPDIDLKGLENYTCPMWNQMGDNKGSFDESGFDIDHIEEFSISQNNDDSNLQALCKSCHIVKTKRFMSGNKNKTIVRKSIAIADDDIEEVNEDDTDIDAEIEFDTDYINIDKKINNQEDRLSNGMKFIIWFIDENYYSILPPYKISSRSIKNAYQTWCTENDVQYNSSQLIYELEKIGISKPKQLRLAGKKKFCCIINPSKIRDKIRKYIKDPKWNYDFDQEKDKYSDTECDSDASNSDTESISTVSTTSKYKTKSKVKTSKAKARLKVKSNVSPIRICLG